MTYKYEIRDRKAWLLNLDTLVYQDTELPKLFHNDILDNNYRVVSSEIKETNYLVGIFSTSQTQRFGKNKKGNIIYLVTPLNNKLPGFLISYGGKLKGKLAVKFKFTNWNNKLPSGEIVDVIGNFNPENMIKILMYHHHIYPKKLKTNENSYESSIERTDLTHLKVFSIDPEDCEDIDDAMSIEINGNVTIVGIHIAQPICWLSTEDIISKMKYQFSTLYIDDDRRDLWGDELTQKASLSEGQQKPVYSTMFYFEDNQLKKIEDYPAFIINKNKLSYDKANECKEAEDLKLFTSKLNAIEDYHDLVSFWMVKTNNHIGIKLKDKIPYRVNDNSSINPVTIVGLPKDIGKIFSLKKIESAYYSFEETRHHTLGLDYYCHFTSPIRRIIDTWIHFYLTYPEARDSLSIDCDLINKLDKETKVFHRQLELNGIIETLFSEVNQLFKSGYISEILSDNTIEVYIEEMGFLRVRLYNLKFDYLLSKERVEDMLKLSYQDKTLTFKPGDLIDLKLDKLDASLPKDRLSIILKEGFSFI
jgi:exoribonuclease R